MKKTIWLGLDVHARSVVIARLDGATEKASVSEVPNEPKLVRRAFERLRKEGVLRCCYEAGPCGFELARQLSAMSIECAVVAPSLIPQRPGDRVKTDRRDATKLARLFRAGELTPIVVPDEAQEAVRDLLRARDDLRKDRVAARHRMTKFLLRHGRRFAAGGHWTQKFWRWVREQTFEHAAARSAFEHYVARVLEIDARMDVIDEEIAALAQTPAYKSRVDRLSTLRGISTLSAMVLLAELGDLRRFEHPRQLMAYAGLVPSERSSGGTRRQGGITKAGNAHVRRILVEAAWSYRSRVSITTRQHRVLAEQPAEVAAIAKRATARLGRRYLRLVSRGKKSQLAATAIARELCGFVWALERAA